MSTDFESLTDEPKGKVKMGHGGRYKLPHPKTGKETLFTRVSTIAHTITNSYNLDQWQYRTIAKGMTIWPDLRAAAKGLDVKKDKTRLQAIATAAKEAGSDASVTANLGTVMHSLTDRLDQGLSIDEAAVIAAIDSAVSDYTDSLVKAGLDTYGLFLDKLTDRMLDRLTTALELDSVLADLDAYSKAISDNGIALDPACTERVVINMEYEIVGRIDRVGKAPRWPLPRIVDIKTGSVTYDHTAFIIQTALYANADFMWNEVTAEWEPFPKVDTSKAIILHLPVGKRACDLLNSPIDVGWQCARLAMHVRTAQKRGKDILTPYLNDYPYRVRIASATSVADLSAVWRDAKAAGMWNDDLQKLGMQKREEIQGAK